MMADEQYFGPFRRLEHERDKYRDEAHLLTVERDDAISQLRAVKAEYEEYKALYAARADDLLKTLDERDKWKSEALAHGDVTWRDLYGEALPKLHDCVAERDRLVKEVVTLKVMVRHEREIRDMYTPKKHRPQSQQQPTTQPIVAMPNASTFAPFAVEAAPMMVPVADAHGATL